MNIEDLTAKTDAAIARVHELQVTIRETEKRMAELHTLKGHIINYVKTREVYAGIPYGRGFKEICRGA